MLGIFIAYNYKEDSSSSERNKQDESTSDSISFKESVSILIKNKEFLSVCLLGSGLGISLGFIPSHFTIYLTQDLDLSLKMAGLALAVVQLGGIIGLPLWGSITDKVFTDNRKLGLVFMAFLLAGAKLFFGLVITVLKPNLIIIFTVSFLLGLLALSWMGTYFTVLTELVPEKISGLANGAGLIFSRSGILFAAPILGHIADINNSYYYSWVVNGVVLLLVALVIGYYQKSYL